MQAAEKENTVRNSKLEMSIKPFTLSREDLSKSKSIDKTRKGISRVQGNPTSQPPSIQPIQPPLSHTFYSSQPILPKPKPIDADPAINNQRALKGTEFDLQCKIELLEKELVVLEKENVQVLGERNDWKNKCKELFEFNQNLQVKIRSIEEQLEFKARSLQDKEELMSKRQRYIEQLMAINAQDKQRLEDSNQHIHKLSLQLQDSANRLADLQARLRNEANVDREQGYEFQEALRSLKEIKESKAEMQEKYRQLLIKASALAHEKEIIEANTRTITYELEIQCEKNSSLVERYRKLEEEFLEVEKQAVFGRACRKQIEELTALKHSHNELSYKIVEYERRIKELQQRRLNQIEFHQEELKRAVASETSKFESLIQIYKKERDEAVGQLQSVEGYRRSAEDNKQQLVDSISRDYEALVGELRSKLVQAVGQKQEKEREFRSIVSQKDQQIIELMSKLNEIKDDNGFLMARLEQKFNSEPLNRSREKKEPQPQQQSLKQTLQGLQGQISQLQNRNKEINTKISEYELEVIKLSDKIHLLQIEAQKYKSREDTYERKIKHLVEEVQHFQEAKNKSIEEKVQLVEEVQTLRLASKNKDIDFGAMEGKVKEIKAALEAALLREKDYKEEMEKLNGRLEKSQSELQQAREQLQSSQKCIAELTEAHKSTLTSFGQQLEVLQKERESYKKCYKLSQEQNEINKEKLLVKQYRTQKEDMQEKEGRLTLYRQFFLILGAECDAGLLAENEILGALVKYIRAAVEKKMEAEVRISKMDIQYRELLDTENATRLLAQKYQEKCLQLEHLLIRMEQAHKDKLVLVKQDYDVVYAKYLKYRNMVIAQNQERSREKGRR